METKVELFCNPEAKKVATVSVPSGEAIQYEHIYGAKDRDILRFPNLKGLEEGHSLVCGHCSSTLSFKFGENKIVKAILGMWKPS